MSTITNYAALLLLLFPFGIQAQYTGGTGGGASSEFSALGTVVTASTVAPGNNTNLIIDVNSAITNSPTLNSITVNPGKRLTINSGETVNISSNGKIRLRANGNGYSQLRIVGGITFGTGATLIQEQMVPATGWVNLGVPLNNSSTVSVFGTINENVPGGTPGTKNLKFWDATSSQWADVIPTTAIEPGRGYNGFVGANGIQPSAGKISVEGIPSTTVEPFVAYHDPGTTTGFTGPADGWNFLSNPFAAALNFAALSLINVENAYYIWNPATSSYQSWAAAGGAGSTLTQYIPPLQGFWVRATAASPSIGSLNYEDHTVDNQTPNFRKTDEIKGHAVLQIAAAHASEQTLDAVTFAFIQGTTSGFDNGWDARKMHNPKPSVNFYSNGNREATAINAIDFNPELVMSRSVPLGLTQLVSGTEYNIALNDLTDMPQVTAFIEDLQAHGYHYFSEGAFSFKANGSESDRFIFHLSTVPGWTPAQAPISLDAWSDGQRLFINPGRSAGPAKIWVMDVMGREMDRFEIPNLEMGQTHAQNIRKLPPGQYVVVVEMATEQARVKVQFF